MKQKGQKTDEQTGQKTDGQTGQKTDGQTGQKGQTEAGVATEKADMTEAEQIHAVILAINETVNAKLAEFGVTDFLEQSDIVMTAAVRYYSVWSNALKDVYGVGYSTIDAEARELITEHREQYWADKERKQNED